MTSTKLYENSNFNEPSRSFKNLLMPSGIEFLNIIKKSSFFYKKLTKNGSKKHKNHQKLLNQFLGKIETLIINKY